LENERSEPQSIAIRAMSVAFNKYPKGDIRYAGTLDEDIASVKAVTLDDVKKFYKDFYGASAGELSVVGDFDEKEIAPLATQLFGSWKSAKPYQRIPNDFAEIPAVNKSFETPDKANAIFFARSNIKMKDDNPDYAAFTLGNFIFGGGFLNSRLATRLRQKEGLSYSVGSNLQVGPLDEGAIFFANAIYAPENVEKLEAAFKDEVQKATTTGFTADELTQAKAGWLLSRKRNRGADGSLVGTLSNYLFINRTFAWDDALDKKVDSLTLEEVNAAMKKYLNLDKISIFKAGDFAKSKKITGVKLKKSALKVRHFCNIFSVDFLRENSVKFLLFTKSWCDQVLFP
jgi:zinc protease